MPWWRLRPRSLRPAAFPSGPSLRAVDTQDRFGEPAARICAMSDPSGPTPPPPGPAPTPAPYAPPLPAATGYPAPSPVGYPGSMPPPVTPSALAMGGTAGLIRQFTGAAGWAVLLGIVTIAVPLTFNRIFFFLPIIGFIAGIQAIRRGQLIGGVVGLGVHAIAGVGDPPQMLCVLGPRPGPPLGL